MACVCVPRRPSCQGRQCVMERESETYPRTGGDHGHGGDLLRVLVLGSAQLELKQFFIIIINSVLAIKLPDWGNALACISWFLLELAMCLLVLPFNGCYALAILAVLFLIVVVALLQQKFSAFSKEVCLALLHHRCCWRCTGRHQRSRE